MVQLGAFTNGSTSADAKQLWASHMGFSQGRLSSGVGNGGGRLPVAPPLPVPNSRDDAGRLIKDWNFYKYRPCSRLTCSLNKHGLDGRWPGLNNTPANRHHLAVVQRPKPNTELDTRAWAELPRLEAGPAHDFILLRYAADARVEEQRLRGVHLHRTNMKARLAETTAAREGLQARAFAEPAFRASS